MISPIFLSFLLYKEQKGENHTKTFDNFIENSDFQRKEYADDSMNEIQKEIEAIVKDTIPTYIIAL